MINLDAPLTVTATAVGRGTLLGEIARLMEAAEQARGAYVRLADRVARWYAPVVHSPALLSFLGWLLVGGLDLRGAVLIAEIGRASCRERGCQYVEIAGVAGA